MSVKGELANVLANDLNKKFKGSKVAYFLDEEENPSDVTDWLSKSVIPGSFGGLGGSVEKYGKHLFD